MTSTPPEQPIVTAHFINHYGRMATEDIVPWRGRSPELHWIHNR